MCFKAPPIALLISTPAESKTFVAFPFSSPSFTISDLYCYKEEEILRSLRNSLFKTSLPTSMHCILAFFSVDIVCDLSVLFFAVTSEPNLEIITKKQAESKVQPLKCSLVKQTSFLLSRKLNQIGSMPFHCFKGAPLPFLPCLILFL